MRVTTVFLAILLSIGAAQAITLYAVDNSTSTPINTTYVVTYNQHAQYQEYATTNSSNLQNGSGSYYVDPTQPYFYINLSKPYGLAVGLNWQYEFGNNSVSQIQNETITTICYNAYSDRLLLRVQEPTFITHLNSSLSGTMFLACYNGTVWNNMIGWIGKVYGVPTGATAETRLYDGNYTTGTFFANASGTLGWYSSTTSAPSANITLFFFEEGGWWNITTSTETILAPTGESTPPGQVNYSSGTSGSVSWNAGTFNVTVSSPGYGSLIVSNISLSSTNYTFNLTPASNTTFVIRDEATGRVINTTTTTISLSSSIYGVNATSTNGTFRFENLTYDYYTVTYSGTNYTQRQIFAYLPSASSANYTLYLLNDTASTLVLFTVLDQTYSVLNGVVVTALKKNLSGTNYYSVAQCTTDLNGECLIGLELYTSTYRFITEYNGVVRNSSDTVLSRNTYTIVLNTQSSTLQNVLNRNDLSASLVYTPTGRFDYTVVDSSGDVHSGLLTIERRYGGRLYSVSSTTGSGSSFIITATGVNVSLGDEIVANGYVYIDGQPILTHSISVIDSTAGGSLGSGLAFLFLGMMFTIVFIFAWNPVAPLIAFGAFVLIMSRIGIIGFGTGAVVAVIVVIGVAIYRMRSV